MGISEGYPVIARKFDFTFHPIESTCCTIFREERRVFMQDNGSKHHTELSKEDLTLSRRELPVESLGHCQSVGNQMFLPQVFARRRLNAKSFRATKVFRAACLCHSGIGARFRLSSPVDGAEAENQ